MSPTLQAPPERVSHVSDALAKSRLGVPSVVFFVIAAAAPLTVIAGGATAGYSTGTLAIPVAYLAVAAVLAVFSVGYVAMSRRIQNAGAFYTYLSRGLGRPAGVSGAFVAIVAYNLMYIGLAIGFGYIASQVASNTFGWNLDWPLASVAALLIIAVFGIAKIDLNGKVLGALLIAEIAITLIYDAVMVTHPASGGITATTLNPNLLWGTGIGAALAVAIAGYVGFESSTVFAEETKDPKRTVARATFIAVAITGLLYGLSAWAMSVATGPSHIVDAATKDGSQLIFNLVGTHIPGTLVDIGSILFVTSLFAATLSFHHTASRYVYSLGRERVLPSRLARTSMKTGAPYNASVLHSILTIAVVILYAITGWDPYLKGFFALTVFGGLGVLILMTSTCVAVISFFARHRRTDPETAWRRLIAPAIAALALAAVLWATLDQLAFLLVVPEGSTITWLLPTAYAAAAVVGGLWAIVLRATRPNIYQVIGLGADTPPLTPGAGA